MSQIQRSKRNRRAMTLIELLVVIGIIVMLLAISIPLMKTMTAGNKVREASRMINAYIAQVQSRAADRQRPCGIWIERGDEYSGAAAHIFAAEVPPPYAGDFIGAKASVTSVPANPIYGRAVFDSQSANLNRLVTDGDFIRFDYKGPYYEIASVMPSPPPPGTPPPVPPNVIKFWYNGTPPKFPLPPNGSVSVSYQILRKPKRSSVGGIELPKSSIVDLEWSGLGNLGTEFRPTNTTSDNTPIIIMFSPTGRVDFVYVQNSAFRPITPIHLLVGRADQVDTPVNRTLIAQDPEMTPNIKDVEAIWISIGHATGSVTNSPNSPIQGGTVSDARSEARQARIMRGSS